MAGQALGLAISKQLAEAMNGSLHIQSKSDQGATFTVELTLPTQPAAITQDHVGIRRKAIFVSKNEDLRVACGRLLAAEGFEVSCLEQIDKALESLSTSKALSHDQLIWVDHASIKNDPLMSLKRLCDVATNNDKIILLAPSNIEFRLLGDLVNRLSAITLKPLTPEKVRNLLAKELNKTTTLPLPEEVTELLSPTAKRTILVAEDNETNQYVIQRQLQHLGWSVLMANDGEEAVHMADQEVFAAILMDLQMPCLNGIEATRQIRSSSKSNRNTPIIALTANAFTDDIANCLEAGMNDHLSKPLRRQTLADTLNKFTGNKFTGKRNN